MRLLSLLALLLISSPAFGLSQYDFGAGTDQHFTLPTPCNELRIYLNGPGGGGGAGNANSAGGGGGSGAKALFVVTGNLGGIQLHIKLPVGGLGGAAPGGNGHLALGHSTVTWPNGLQMIAGAGAPGYGGNGQPGPGGRGGNVATNTPDQGGGAVWPAEWVSFGQFNLGAPAGMDGTLRLWGHGGNEGDTGGGGKGGWWNQNGEPGQGGYAHIECN